MPSPMPAVEAVTMATLPSSRLQQQSRTERLKSSPGAGSAAAAAVAALCGEATQQP